MHSTLMHQLKGNSMSATVELLSVIVGKTVAGVEEIGDTTFRINFGDGSKLEMTHYVGAGAGGEWDDSIRIAVNNIEVMRN